MFHVKHLYLDETGIVTLCGSTMQRGTAVSYTHLTLPTIA